MIYGVGVDVVHLPAFAEQLALPGSRFAEGVFTAAERATAQDRHEPARHLAARWAAKEALIKALDGARFGLPPQLSEVDLRDVELVNDVWGRPALRLAGPIATVAEGLRTYVSLSHDGPTVVAMVVVTETQSA